MNSGFAIKTAYRHEEVIIRLQGTITEESIIALCDEVNLALDYYFYHHVVLQIDSPGGRRRRSTITFSSFRSGESEK